MNVGPVAEMRMRIRLRLGHLPLCALGARASLLLVLFLASTSFGVEINIKPQSFVYTITKEWTVTDVFYKAKDKTIPLPHPFKVYPGEFMYEVLESSEVAIGFYDRKSEE